MFILMLFCSIVWRFKMDSLLLSRNSLRELLVDFNILCNDQGGCTGSWFGSEAERICPASTIAIVGNHK